MHGVVKIRKTWGQVKPYEQPHSTKSGKRGYDRKETRRLEREAHRGNLAQVSG